MRHSILTLVAAFVMSSCDPPGRRAAQAQSLRPAELADFHVLYAQNCAGCHGADGQGAIAVGIGRPLYLAIADDVAIRKTIERGIAGSAMPAFAQMDGGSLTEEQIDILTRGMRQDWAKGAIDSEQLPAYSPSHAGDPRQGHDVFKSTCAPCHGMDGQGDKPIVDSTYLALVSDQHLRMVTIVGMPKLGMPDSRSYEKPLSDSDVTDVVAWLSAQRKQ